MSVCVLEIKEGEEIKKTNRELTKARNDIKREGHKVNKRV
jgi:hypothetical protein